MGDVRVTTLEWVLAALATWRLTWLVTEDKITERPREWLAERARDASKGLAYLVTCPFCVSVWLAVPVLAWVYLLDGPWSYLPLGVPAVSIVASAGSVWLER